MLAKGGNHPTEMAGSVLRALEGSLRAFERHRQLILGLRQDALVRLTLSDHFYTPTLRPKSPRRGR